MPDHNMDLVADLSRGFTKIPNLLFEALMCTKLTRTQRYICDFILRHTYGWNRKEVPISINEFVFNFKSERSWIRNQLNDLLDKKIVLKTRISSDKKSVLKMNPNIFEWDRTCFDLDQLLTLQSYRPSVMVRKLECCNPPGVGYCNPPGMGYCNPPGVEGSNTPLEPASSLEHSQSQTPLNKVLNKNINTFKDNEKSNKSNNNSACYELAELLLEKIRSNHPDYQIPDLNEWALIIYKMMEKDKRDPEAIRKAILFAHGDDFWKDNIVNAFRLMTQFDLLNAQRLRKERAQSGRKKNNDEYEIFLL